MKKRKFSIRPTASALIWRRSGANYDAQGNAVGGNFGLSLGLGTPISGDKTDTETSMFVAMRPTELIQFTKSSFEVAARAKMGYSVQSTMTKTKDGYYNLSFTFKKGDETIHHNTGLEFKSAGKGSLISRGFVENKDNEEFLNKEK